MERGGTLIMNFIKYFLSEDEPKSILDFKKELLGELKSTTKAALTGAGVGGAFGAHGTRQNVKKMGLSGDPRAKTTIAVGGALYGAIGAAGARYYKKTQIKNSCAKRYKTQADRTKCFNFRNKHGKFPGNRKELEFGAPKPKGA